jgi:hypothetical protein
MKKEGREGKGTKTSWLCFFYCINLFLLQTTGKKTNDIVEISLKTTALQKNGDIIIVALYLFIKFRMFPWTKGGRTSHTRQMRTEGGCAAANLRQRKRKGRKEKELSQWVSIECL